VLELHSGDIKALDDFGYSNSIHNLLGWGLRLQFSEAAQNTFAPFADGFVHSEGNKFWFAGTYGVHSVTLMNNLGQINTNFRFANTIDANPHVFRTEGEELTIQMRKRDISFEFYDLLQSIFEEDFEPVRVRSVIGGGFYDLLESLIINNAWTGSTYEEYQRIVLSLTFDNIDDTNNFLPRFPTLQLTLLRVKDCLRYEFYVRNIDDLIMLASDVANLNAAYADGIGMRPSYFQTKDISGIVDWNMREVPTVREFWGLYCGGENVIEYVVFTENDHLAGMFGVLHGTVRDLTLREVIVLGLTADFVGGVAAVIEGGAIERVIWKGYIYRDDDAEMGDKSQYDAVGYINGVFFDESNFSHAEIVEFFVKDFYFLSGAGTAGDEFIGHYFRQLRLVNVYTFASFKRSSIYIAAPHGFGYYEGLLDEG
jgi:hypothetical protein